MAETMCPRCGWVFHNGQKLCRAPWACQERRADPSKDADRRDPEFLKRLRARQR